MNWKALRLQIAAVILLAVAGPAFAAIDGVTGPNFTLTARDGYISTPEGGSIYTWSFANGTGGMQYPGPTLIVNQGDLVTVTLVNTLTVPVSIVFPGQQGVTEAAVTAPAAQGALALEAGPSVPVPGGEPVPGGTVVYSFVASKPGTYMYHSGTRTDLQIPMGLVGALIVRPSDGEGGGLDDQAYEHPDSMFDVEYLFLMTEIDPRFNAMVEEGKMDQLDTNDFFPVLWFLNGRCAPDTMIDAFVPWLPAQPYNCMPMMEPGQKLLMRLVGAGRDSHPFHFHGNHAKVIARDARLLSSAPGAGADLGPMQFTIQTLPGETDDAIFTWTGEKLGWDIYGHQQDLDNEPAGNFPAAEDVDHNKNGVLDDVPMEPNEYAPDHGKPFPVILPNTPELTFGSVWSGSPFLGREGNLPPGASPMRSAGSYFYMWHSHTEKEMVNNDVFPGGMMTMLMIMPPMPMPMKTANQQPADGGR